MTTDAETAAKAATDKQEDRFQRLFHVCLDISVRPDQNNQEWFAISWARAVEISSMYARQMGVAPPVLPAAALPAVPGVLPTGPIPHGGVVATPDFSTQPANGPAGPVPMPSSDYQTAPAVPQPGAAPAPAVAPAAPPAAPAVAGAPAVAAAPASVFGPQFQGWPAVELEGVLHAAQGWSLCREGNGTPEQFAEVMKEVTDALEALAQRRIAMMLEKQGQG